MRNRNWLLLIILPCIVVSSWFAFAGTAVQKEKITVASYHIPLLVDDTENGAFVMLLREGARRVGVEYELTLYPTRRAMLKYEDGEVMALMPALLPTLSKDGALAGPIFTKKIHAIVLDGQTIPSNIEALEGLRVGLVRGFSYPRSIMVNENIHIDYADTTGRSLLRLKEGRVDVVVADGYTAKRAIEQLEIQGLHYDLAKVLDAQPAYIAFQPDERGRELAYLFTRAIEEMRRDGTYDSFMPDID